MIWIIDSQHWPRACIRAELIERGFETDGFEYLSEALDALGNQVKPDLIIFETQEQPVDAADLHVLERLRIPVVGLGGAAEWENAAYADFPWKARFRRPFSIGELCDAVESIL